MHIKPIYLVIIHAREKCTTCQKKKRKGDSLVYHGPWEINYTSVFPPQEKEWSLEDGSISLPRNFYEGP